MGVLEFLVSLFPNKHCHGSFFFRFEDGPSKLIPYLMSSKFVDKNISKMALSTGNCNSYKNKGIIPPLMMQDDTLAVSVCGVKTMRMNNFINTRTNIIGLQFKKINVYR